MTKFEMDYARLEKRFKHQVQKDRHTYGSDNIVFLPTFPKPKEKVDFVIIGMEPSLTNSWAGNPPNQSDAEIYVQNGFCDFLPFRFEDLIVRYVVLTYLGKSSSYYMTNVSKGAMILDLASWTRKQRWADWFPLLRDELDLVAKKDAKVFALGRQVYNFLRRKQIKTNDCVRYYPLEWIKSRFQNELNWILHHSPQTIPARNQMVKENENEYQKALLGVTKEKLVRFADEILKSGGATQLMTDWCLGELTNRHFNENHKKLIYCYWNQLKIFAKSG
jgi:hypothetical protein